MQGGQGCPCQERANDILRDRLDTVTSDAIRHMLTATVFKTRIDELEAELKDAQHDARHWRAIAEENA